MAGLESCGDPKIVIEFDDNEGFMKISLSDDKSTITADIRIIGEGAPLVGCHTYHFVRDFLTNFIERNLRDKKRITNLLAEGLAQGLASSGIGAGSRLGL